VHNETLLLPKAAFLTAWKWAGYGRPHAVIGADEIWLDPETRRKLEDKVLDTLTKLGLAADGTLTRDFRDTLAVFARSTRRYYAWVGDIDSGQTGGVLVAARGEDAVRLLREDKLVRIDPVHPGRMAEVLVDSLPDTPPASIDEITMPVSAYATRERQSLEEMIYDPPQGDVSEGGVRRLRELMAGQRSGAHQLYASITGEAGVRRSKPLTALDIIDRGRVLTFRSTRPGEGSHICCMAGSRHNIVNSLNATLAALS
jgi:hypothetical protein